MTLMNAGKCSPIMRRLEVFGRKLSGQRTWEGRSSVSVTLANDRDEKTAAVHSFSSERFVIQIDGIQPDSLAKARLDYIALRMQQILRLSALVTGHTDARGAEELNLRVGQRRADAMRDYLVRQHNLEPGRIETGSEGERRPMVDNQAPVGRRQNRARRNRTLSFRKSIAALTRTQRLAERRDRCSSSIELPSLKTALGARREGAWRHLSSRC